MKRTYLRASVALLVTGSLAFGCFDFGALEGGSTCLNCEAGVDAPGAAFTISVAPSLSLQQATSLPVDFEVTRTGGFTGAVNFIVSGLPAGVSANELVVGSDATSGVLTLTADPNAPQSLTHLSIYGVAVDGPSVSANTKTDLVVRGPPGSLDTLFGSNGFVVAPLAQNGFYPFGITFDADGNILLVGGEGFLSGGPSDPDGGLTATVSIARLRSDGTFDPTFGDGGTVRQGFETITSDGYEFTGIFALDGGGVLTAGRASADTVLARFSASGALDPSFTLDGGPGYVANDPTGAPVHFVMDPSGKLLGSGLTSDKSLYVERRLSNGALDPSFGTSGVIGAPFAGSVVDDAIPRLQRDGNLLLAVASNPVGMSGIRVLDLVRLADGGAFDPTFGDAGYAGPNASTNFDQTSDLAVQSDGRIVVLGAVYAGVGTTVEVARFGTNGMLDGTFGTSGIANVPGKFMPALAVQADDKIVVAGYGDEYQMRVDRLLASGALDPSFGTGGIMSTTYGVQSYATVMGIQSDGRIVVAGLTVQDGGSGFIVERFWP